MQHSTIPEGSIMMIGALLVVIAALVAVLLWLDKGWKPTLGWLRGNEDADENNQVIDKRA